MFVQNVDLRKQKQQQQQQAMSMYCIVYDYYIQQVYLDACIKYACLKLDSHLMN